MVSGRKEKIPQEMIPGLLSMQAQGKTVKEIQEFLAHNNIKVSTQNIYKRLNKHTKQAKETLINKIVVNAEKSVVNDLSTLDIMQATLFKLFMDCVETKNYSQLCKLSGALHQWSELKLKLVPIDINDKTDAERAELIEEMVARLSN
jgi:hypothetical protein